MTHDERVFYHTYTTCETPAEHAERIVKLEELVMELWEYINAPVNQRNSLKERLAIYDDLADRMSDLGIEVDG